uniref:Recoverin n=2 Tax=Bursaphelenchus xylophilus TaxID=6326 RepID=A0A1I7RHY6_BURXY
MNEQELMEFRSARKANIMLGPVPVDVTMAAVQADDDFAELPKLDGPNGVEFGRSGNCATPRGPQVQHTLYMSASDQLLPSVGFHAGTLDFSNMESMDFTESTRISQYNPFPSTPKTSSLREYELLESKIHLEHILTLFSQWDAGMKAKFMREFRGNSLLDDFLIQHFKSKGT